MSKIRIANVITSNVDGPGQRRVLYVQGCPVHCPGCQSPRLWDPIGGTEHDVEDAVAMLLDGADLPVTISGGEPFAQADAVADLLTLLRVQRPELHITVYSGYVLEDLLEIAPAIPSVLRVLKLADVLVDGPFIQELDHDRLQWRGSSNQRPINLHRSTWYGTDIVDLVLEGWDTAQRLTVDRGGDVIGTAGLMRELFVETEPTRMCGQAPRDAYTVPTLSTEGEAC